MAIESQFITVSDSSTESASTWIYLVDWILVLVLGILFIFYFGRLVGFVLSIFARIIWRNSNIRINMESVRFSLLGGRLMMKNLTIMTENWTISVLRVNFTWRYWLGGHTRKPEYLVHNNDDGSEDSGIKKSDNEKLPSRFLLTLDGYEVYMYNRTYAYDNIMEILNRENPDSNVRYRSRDTNQTQNKPQKEQENEEKESSSSVSSDTSLHDNQPNKSVKTLARLLRFLPLSISIKRGVMILGNHTTPNLLVSTCKVANGIIDITKPSSEFDIYKQFLFFELQEFQVFLKPNIMYKPQPPTRFKTIKKLFSKKNRSIVDDIQWSGLRRYVETNDDVLDNISHTEEYAKYSLILDTVSTKINYYYDILGNEVNSTFPEFGCDMEFSMATIHYGAWADKQRVPLQNMFVPVIGRDTIPTKLNKRQYKGFKMNIVTNDEIIMRIPTREESKDKEALKHHTQPQNKRPFGWLELKMGPNSSFSSFNSFISSTDAGTPNKLSMVWVQPEVRSSVNHDILYTADIHTLNASIGFPLGLNQECNWVFDNFSSNGRIFFLREHTLLFSDIFADFGSGPPPKYENFRPFKYHFNWDLRDYKLYLNVNDSNIINNPLDFSSNKYFSFQGNELKLNLLIPLLGQFSNSTSVEFNCSAPYFDLILDVPPWHTGNSFLAQSYTLGRAHNCIFEGSYTYLSKIEAFGFNTIIIKCKTDDVSLKFYGFLVKYVFVLRENYLGDKFHFKTFEEYNNEIHDDLSEDSIKEDFDYWKVIKTENNVDVLFSFQVRRGLLVLPQDIYGCKAHVGLIFDYFDTDIRFTNYYMDMEADFSPIKGKYLKLESEDIILDRQKYEALINNDDEQPHIEIDDLTVHGHRMFGIPPQEITYYCNWRGATNSVMINAPPQFLDNFGKCVSNFLTSFQDLENALHAAVPTVYDALVFTFDCPILDMKLNCHDRSFQTRLDSLLVTYNDIGNKRYSNKFSVKIDEITHKVLDTTNNNILSLFKTSLMLDNPTKKANFSNHGRLQQEHIRFNDAPFHRAPFLLYEENRDVNYKQGYGSFIVPISLIDVNYPLNSYTQRDEKHSLNSSVESLSTSFESMPTQMLYFEPTTHYAEEDFQPDSQRDETFKHDNMIFTFSEVNGYITPEAIKSYAVFNNVSLDTDLSGVMDSFEKSIVKHLKLLMLKVCRNDTFRIVSPFVNIAFGETYDTNQSFDYLNQQGTISIRINEPSIALSEEVKRIDLNEDNDINSNSLLDYEKVISSAHAFSVKSIFINVAHSLELGIHELEVWQTNDTQSVFSFNIDKIKLDIEPSKIIELIQYFHDISTKLMSSIALFKVADKVRDKRTMALLYKLSMASKEFKIDHDPSVLTKPASIIRSLKQHIRFFDTWLVMIRLRHIFENMDNEWLTREYECLQESDWEIPENAYDEVLDTFSNWRSWEANYPEREFFLQKIFNIKPLREKKTIFQILLNTVELNLNQDHIVVEHVSFSFNDRKVNASFSRTNREENDFDAKLGSLELSVNLGNYKSVVSASTIRLIPEVVEEIERLCESKSSDSKSKCFNKNQEQKTLQESSKEQEPKQASSNFGFFFIININEFNQEFHLNSINLDISAIGLNSTGLFQIIESQRLFTLTNSISMLGINLQNSASIGFEDLRIVYGDACNSHLTNLFIGSCFIELSDKNLAKTIKNCIEQDLVMFEFLNSDKPTKSQDPMDLLNKILGLNADLSLQVNHFSWVIDVLNNYRFEGNVIDSNISFIISEDAIDAGCLFQKVSFTANSKAQMILEIKNSQLFNNIRLFKNGEGLPGIFIDSQFGYSKVFSPRLIRSLNDFLDTYRDLRVEFEDIIKAINQTKKETDPENQGSKEVQTKTTFSLSDIPIEVKFCNYYIGVSFLSDRSKFSFELEELKLDICNFENVDDISIVDYYGSIILPTARISVTDRIIPIGLSNLLDFNMSLKLVNEPKGKLLEVQSDHFRVCLSLGVIQRLIYLVDEFDIISKRIKREIDVISTTKGSTKSETNFDISSIHFLSYNFCLGWIFERGSKDYPGIIMGAERFYAVTDEGLGKLSLIEAYLSVAHGSDSTSFYGQNSEKDEPNRAFLPFVQFVYIINEINKDDGSIVKDMKMTITGDELDAKFLSDSFQLLELAVNSVSNVQAVFDKRVRPMDKWKDDSKTDEQQQVDYLNSLKSTFESIECNITFAGSNVLIHRLSVNTSPLFLHFPAVKSSISYIHDKVGVKKHILRSQVFTSSSDNKLFSSCVPVVIDLIDSIRRAMKRSSHSTDLKPKDPKPGNTSEHTSDQKPEKEKSINFASLLEETDFYIGIIVDKQIVSLSCEPTAKVEAVVGIEGLSFQAMSGTKSTIHMLGNLQSISIALRHIYSREVSGYFKIDSILSTVNISYDDQVTVKSSGSISDVDGYIDIKQYQDIQLFRDIWFPQNVMHKDMKHDDTVSESLASNKNIALRFKEVSTTNAIPWMLTYMLSNVSIKMNLGPSLGEILFKLNKFWIMSKKSIDWTQDVKLGIDSFILTSKGRLGGEISVDDVYLQSGISWKMNNETLDVPLISTSAGLEKLQIKSTFDYHLFLVSSLEQFSVDVFNQKSENTISKDHLFVSAKFKDFEIFMSSFTISNMYDIYITILRMTQENTISYKQTLHDSKTKKHVLQERVHNNAILETVKKLETEFEVIMGSLSIYIYPSSFDDSKVLRIKLDESTAFFSQNEYNEGISNQLEIQFNDLLVSLSMNTTVSENFLNDTEVDEFIKYAHKARGGNIFLFPSFQISMKTFQKYRSSLVEYLYKSTFEGTVDIRWNLGSINFIREMYSIHLKSLESRTEVKNTMSRENVEFNEDIFKNPSHHSTLTDALSDPIENKEIDEAINDRFEKVEKESKYSYLPLAPPIIEAPQLKELGNATPPLEWFGLHRNKFPNVTHEIAIVNLQRVIHEIETEYSRLLGRA